jgi:hypothetical protein
MSDTISVDIEVECDTCGEPLIVKQICRGGNYIVKIVPCETCLERVEANTIEKEYA